MNIEVEVLFADETSKFQELLDFFKKKAKFIERKETKKTFMKG